MTRVRRASSTWIAALLACWTSCAEQPRTAIRFSDATAGSGLEFVTTSGGTPSSEIVEVKGGGVGLIDFERDGDWDVFVPNGATMDAPSAGPGCRLFENLGGLRFKDATARAELTFRRWGIGVAVADANGDGCDDLYVTAFGPNALLLNSPEGRFRDATETAGVGGNEWSAAGAFGDLDRDGDLDLYVANYLEFDLAHPPPRSTFKGEPVFTGPIGLEPEADVLYENLGDGRFRDISASSGCRAVAPAFGLGALILDFDGDGAQDIYVGNDSLPNYLFENRGGLRFEEDGLRSGLSVNIDGSAQSTMGIAIADVEESGRPSVFTTNFSNDTNTLHVNQGRFFDDQTRRYGLGMVSSPYVGWAAGFYDFEHDSDEDLLIFNGHVYPNATTAKMDAEYAEPALCFERVSERFELVTDARAGPFGEPHRDRGAAFGDLDGDGDVDVVVSELNGPLRLLRNDCTSPNWLIVELAPAALGSRLELTCGARRQTRWIYSGGSFVSASAQLAHFGLPPGVTTADLLVTWPDGVEERREHVPIGQRLRVTRTR